MPAPDGYIDIDQAPNEYTTHKQARYNFTAGVPFWHAREGYVSIHVDFKPGDKVRIAYGRIGYRRTLTIDLTTDHFNATPS